MRRQPSTAPVTRHGFKWVPLNHNETLVRVTPSVRHGSTGNHNETFVRVAPAIRHGLAANHNETLIRVAPVIRYEFNLPNHNETLVRTGV